MIPAAHSLGRARWTWWVLLGFVLVYGITASRGGFGLWPQVFLRFGVSREEFLLGHIWQLLTHVFLHGNGMHLLTNGLLFLLLGSRIEDIFGRKMLFLCMLYGALGGGLMHLFLVPSGGLLIGASGIVMAMLLLNTTVSPQSRLLVFPLSAGNLGLGVLISSLVLSLINPVLELPMLSGIGAKVQVWYPGLFAIGHACHLGGSLAGFLLGRWLLRAPVSLEKLQKERRQREGSAAE